MRRKVNEVLYDEFSVVDDNDAVVAGLVDADFTKSLWGPSGSLEANAVTITELGQGRYRVAFTPTETGEWGLSIFHPTYFSWGKDGNYHIDTGDINDLYNMEYGRWKVDNNQMTFYKPDGVTVLATFDLKDAAGNPTEFNPFERTVA